jgi:hypothetical protein
MKSPLLVVGAARSGTTLIAERLLGSHPDVLYWSEPAFVWRYGNAYKLHDMIAEDDGSRHIRRSIREAFEAKAVERPDALLVEKTPGNSYRMAFVLSVLPEAKVLHVIRDGRQVARSAREEWAGRAGSALDSTDVRRLAGIRRLAALVGRDLRWRERCVGPLSIVELPAYVPRLLSFLLRQMLHVSWLPWGPRFPGILRTRWQLGPLGVAAVQWRLSVDLIRSACGELGPERYQEIRFEELQKSPERSLRTIQEFAGLEAHGDWMDRCLRLVKPRCVDPCAGLTDAEVTLVEDLIGEALAGAGYPRIGESAGSRSGERSHA